jgi:hypothetical protein
MKIMSFTYLILNLKTIPYRDKMCNIINNINKQQVIDSNNKFKLNLYKRLKKYIELRTGETRKDIIYKWLKYIYLEEYNGNNPFIKFIREWLQHTPTDANIIKYSKHFIQVYYKLLEKFENYPETKGVRLFNLFPNKHSFALSNIEICTTSLGDIISYLTETSKPPDFMDKKRQHWFELLNVEKIETHSRKIWLYNLY